MTLTSSTEVFVILDRLGGPCHKRAMKSVSAASRYARATLQLAGERKVMAEVVGQAAVLHEVLSDAALADKLANPRLDKAERGALVAAVAKACKLDAVIANLLKLLAANSRLALLPAVLEEMQAMADAAGGIARVQVQAAGALSEVQAAALKAIIKADMKAKEVVLETTPNPALLGGFMAFFGGKVWDASLAGQFRRLKGSLVDATHEFHQNH